MMVRWLCPWLRLRENDDDRLGLREISLSFSLDWFVAASSYNVPYLSLPYLGVQYTAQYNETVVQVHSHLHFSKEEMEIQPSE